MNTTNPWETPLNFDLKPKHMVQVNQDKMIKEPKNEE